MKENWERKLFYLLTPALMGDPFTAGLRAVLPPCRDARAGQHSFLRRTITEDGFAQISGVGPKMASDFAALFVAAI
jgi:hypothetical protein